MMASRSGKRKTRRRLSVIGAILVAVVGMGCEPDQFLAKNMCRIFNCETLFFLPALFPLSAGPTATETGGAAEAEEEESGGGH